MDGTAGCHFIRRKLWLYSGCDCILALFLCFMFLGLRSSFPVKGAIVFCEDFGGFEGTWFSFHWLFSDVWSSCLPQCWLGFSLLWGLAFFLQSSGHSSADLWLEGVLAAYVRHAHWLIVLSSTQFTEPRVIVWVWGQRRIWKWGNNFEHVSMVTVFTLNNETDQCMLINMINTTVSGRCREDICAVYTLRSLTSDSFVCHIQKIARAQRSCRRRSLFTINISTLCKAVAEERRVGNQPKAPVRWHISRHYCDYLVSAGHSSTASHPDSHSIFTAILRASLSSQSGSVSTHA